MDLKQLIEILPSYFFIRQDTWRKIGIILTKKKLSHLWIEKTKQCNKSYNNNQESEKLDNLVEEFKKEKHPYLTKQTIQTWCKVYNPAEYYRLLEISCLNKIVFPITIENVSNILFTCVKNDIGYLDNVFYSFNENYWEEIENIRSYLLNVIRNKVVYFYKIGGHNYNEWYKLSRKSFQEKVAEHCYLKIIKKSNWFSKSCDKNPCLFAYENGVFDKFKNDWISNKDKEGSYITNSIGFSKINFNWLSGNVSDIMGYFKTYFSEIERRDILLKCFALIHDDCDKLSILLYGNNAYKFISFWKKCWGSYVEKETCTDYNTYKSIFKLGTTRIHVAQNIENFSKEVVDTYKYCFNINNIPILDSNYIEAFHWLLLQYRSLWFKEGFINEEQIVYKSKNVNFKILKMKTNTNTDNTYNNKIVTNLEEETDSDKEDETERYAKLDKYDELYEYADSDKYADSDTNSFIEISDTDVQIAKNDISSNMSKIESNINTIKNEVSVLKNIIIKKNKEIRNLKKDLKKIKVL